ncbi:MAG: 3-dehydroquinate synthase [Hyphomonadaceae bacterium]
MSQARVARVDLGARSYDIVIGDDVLAQAGARVRPFAPGGRAFVVTDENVARLHGAALDESLRAGDLRAETLVLAPGEHTKSFAGLERVCAWLIEAGLERRDIVIAFGGGVIGDLAGLAAGVVKRGVDFVQVPTTLLAQVDSSVGGKTAIDTPQGKNLVGLFHQPRLVLADIGVLRTLPPRELLAGYAEVVKYGLIDDPAFFDWCEANAGRVLAGDVAALTYAVEASVAAKARIVGLDERESGPRALLNLGHTFAHALETAAGYDGGQLLHGEAVGAGMALAFELSARLGLCPGQDAMRVRRHLTAAGFAVDLRGAPYAADPDALLGYMARDKKAEGGKLVFILARGVGQAFVERNVDPAAVRAVLADAIAR